MQGDLQQIQKVIFLPNYIEKRRDIMKSKLPFDYMK